MSSSVGGAARRHWPACAALIVVCLLSWACSSGDNPTEPAAITTFVTGTWDLDVEVLAGTAAPAGTMGTMIATLSQDGTTFSGTFVFDDGDSGTISGRFAERDFLFDATQTTASCPGVFSGQGTISESNSGMSGTYAGEACGGTINARFAGFKRQQ